MYPVLGLAGPSPEKTKRSGHLQGTKLKWEQQQSLDEVRYITTNTLQSMVMYESTYMGAWVPLCTEYMITSIMGYELGAQVGSKWTSS